MLVSLVSVCLMALVLSASADDFENLNNMAVANNALSLSYLSSTFFSCHLSPGFGLVDCSAQVAPQAMTFTLDDFVAGGYNETVYGAVSDMTYQQYYQVEYILQLVDEIGGNDFVVTPACNYTFTNTTSLQTFLSNGLKLTHQLLGFYNGATYSIGNSSRLQIAAQSLASTQAHHAAYLSLLLGLDVSPSSGFDSALTIGMIAGSVSSYLGRCSTPPFVSQTIRPYGVAYGGPGVTTYTGPRAQAANVVYTNAMRLNDIEMLNFLLFLESMQRALYINATNNVFTSQSLTARGYNAPVIRPMIGKFITEGAGHTNLLRQQITRLNGQPVDCVYDFDWWLPVSEFAFGLSYSISSITLWSYTVLAGAVIDTQVQRQMAMLATVVARHNTLLAMWSNGYMGYVYDGDHLSGLPDEFTNIVDIDMIREIIANGLHVSDTCNGIVPSISSSSSSSSAGVQPPVRSSSSSSTGQFPFRVSSSSSTGVAPNPNPATSLSSSIPDNTASSTAPDHQGDLSSSSGRGGPGTGPEGEVNDASSTPSNGALFWTIAFSCVVVMLW